MASDPLNQQENNFKFILPMEAPVFQPTVDEFKNPLDYINKIRPIAEKYGICKIQPPSQIWQPPFSLNADTFKFRPRIQNLNKLHAENRIKLEFLNQIRKFWECKDKKIKLPIATNLDLHRLYSLVIQEGGFENVSKQRKWHILSQSLGLHKRWAISYIKQYYERILLPFEIYMNCNSKDGNIFNNLPEKNVTTCNNEHCERQDNAKFNSKLIFHY